MRSYAHLLCSLLAFVGWSAVVSAAEPLKPVRLTPGPARVQPWTGLVLWDDAESNRTDAIQLEFSYLKYSDVVRQRDSYDWTVMDRKLAAIAGRRHQAIFRFYDTYPGQPTTVPAYIKARSDYHETQGQSEGQPTGFPDWAHPELQRFLFDFFTRFAARYDRDPRLAYLEVGFGLWAEYHLYDGPLRLGHTFPDAALQARFLRHLGEHLHQTPWLISVDAADADVGPFTVVPDLLALPFGTFDDSFLGAKHKQENEPNWNALGRDRWQRAPAGGEFSYYTKRDQRQALAPQGPHGESFEAAARRFHLTFMIANDQPQYQSWDRIRTAGRACGYRFRIERCEASAQQVRVTIGNVGIAPPYFDAYVALNGQRSGDSLRGLQPGQTRTITGPATGSPPVLTIVSDRLVPGQQIDYDVAP